MPTSTMDQMLNSFSITRTVYLVARSIDRCDRALLESCFWPDATDDHGIYKGSARGFIDWVMPLLPATFERTQHAISNVLVDFEGTDVAHSEATFVAYHRPIGRGDAYHGPVGGEQRDMVSAGRYLDRFERRDGEWRIAERRAVYDWMIDIAATDQNWLASPMREQLVRGRQGPDDRSYTRT